MSQLNLIGKTLGRFEILRELGRGGMAVVYEARQTDLERIVALKVLSPALTHDASYVARFRQEARSVARLEHPHIMPIYEIGEADGVHYIAMKYIAGRTVKDLIHDEGRLIVPRAAQVLIQVADALDYAHRQGVIHRDIKPSNMMITSEGWLYLTDFGLARGTDPEASSGLTLAGTVMGTPEYMSPEQAQGSTRVGPATDIYALGVVLYELLTGSFPFTGETPMAMLAARLMQPPTPLREVRGDLSPAVEDVVMRALARNPDARYPRAMDMVAALRQAANIGTDELPHAGTPAMGSPMIDATIKMAAPPPPTPPYVRSPQGQQAHPQTQAHPHQQQQQGTWPTPAPTPATPAPARPRNLMAIVGVLGVVLLSCIGLFAALSLFDRGPGSPPTSDPPQVTLAVDPRFSEQLAAADALLADPNAGLTQAQRTYTILAAEFDSHPLLVERWVLATAARGAWPESEGLAHTLITAADSSDDQVATGYAILAEALAMQGNLNTALLEADQARSYSAAQPLGHAMLAHVRSYEAFVRRDEAMMEQALLSLDAALDRLDDNTPLLQRALTHSALGGTFANKYRLSGDVDYFEESANQYDEAIDLLPSAGRFRIELAELYYHADDHVEARELYEEAKRIDPDVSHQALAGLGWLAFMEARDGAAAQFFTEAIAANPAWYEGYFGQARLRFDERDYDGALALLDQAIEHNPHFGVAYEWRGEAYFWKGYAAEGSEKSQFLERSVAAFEQALDLNATNSFAAMGLGWSLQHLERYEESIAAFDQALALNTELADAHNGRGWSLFNLGRYEEAEAAFGNAIALNQYDPQYHINLGQTLEQLGQRRDARSAYEYALALDPANAQAQELLAALGN
ncbi:MAG: tetratricopeptide repeat protein [Candidatus Viridilinea halotolerans]|uniref:non-specific serine/threonine protein kinase n=1 Tax=Candidatus Viridilinea halotolerans TaxID=2491704 RepID=A0A426TRT3_9CHLR|nr:MAG: tetratricopeptide repeat protein [Candidatus Viridilinea halotolerans]